MSEQKGKLAAMRVGVQRVSTEANRGTHWSNSSISLQSKVRAQPDEMSENNSTMRLLTDKDLEP